MARKQKLAEMKSSPEWAEMSAGAGRLLKNVAGLRAALEQLRSTENELIAARRNTEHERGRYHDLFEFAPDAYLITDEHGKILEGNFAAANLLNVSQRFLPGKPLFVFFHGYESHLLCRTVRNACERERSEEIVRLAPRDRSQRVVHATIGVVRGPDGQVQSLRWMLRDISAQQLADRELHAGRRRLRKMASRLALVEEQERRRIATEIHDHISQSLAVAKLRLGMLREAVRGEHLENLDQVRDLLSKTLAQTRTLTFELSPTVLYELGLGAAIEWLIEQRGGYGIEFKLDDQSPGLRLRRDLEVTLFQSVRELLTNIIKHARASSATVGLTQDSDALVIDVADNGVGFDAPEQSGRRPRGASLGLLSVHERLEHLGGGVEIRSTPESGTHVRLTAPLRFGKRKSSHLEKRNVVQRPDRRRSPDPSPGAAVAVGEGA